MHCPGGYGECDDPASRAGRCGLAEPVAIATGSLRLVGGCDPGVVVEVVS